jgi:hypothetical protein
MAGLQLMARLSEPHKKLFMGVLDDFNFNSWWTRL